jgi:hypothetical protein
METHLKPTWKEFKLFVITLINTHALHSMCDSFTAITLADTACHKNIDTFCFPLLAGISQPAACCPDWWPVATTSSAVVKNPWGSTSTSPIRRQGFLLKHEINFIFECCVTLIWSVRGGGGGHSFSK